ncbi:MAG: diguanylate cyclase [Myxococcaceae bacterium]|nr:diguanylate cyclase [Myxococcaceae bacterium]
MGVHVGATVLVVEDEPEILRLMKSVLGRDFNVLTAASAEEALQLLQTEKVAAIISDQMLPAMSGVELLKEVATRQPDAARVLVTASARVDTLQEAINVARVKRFLAKPFRAAELLAVVGEAIHEMAVAQIKSELVRELKGRNVELSRAMAELEARDKDLSSKLEGLAFRDGVTGLFTHRYFQETLAAEVARARISRRPVSIVLADVDGFRRFNREYGFAEGDLALRTVAAVVASTEAAARYGSNRFAAILPGVDQPGAHDWAERVRAEVERRGKSRSSPGAFTVRCGVAAFPEIGPTESELVDACERALAEAGLQGGNRVVIAAAQRA